MSDRPTALITGASSGIGEAFARAVAARAYDVVLVARRQERLRELASALTAQHGVAAQVLVADLSTPSGVDQVMQGVDTIQIDLLINNAGFGSYGAFWELPQERELQMIDLNVRALVALTGHFLPKMVSRGAGGIIQIASTAAFQPVPFMATYAATKAFVLHFSEAVAREVHGSGVRVVAVCPGHTPTEFQSCSGVDRRRARTPMQSADDVVREALDAYERCSSSFVVTGLPNKIITQSSRVLPRRVLSWVVAHAFRPGPGSQPATTR